MGCMSVKWLAMFLSSATPPALTPQVRSLVVSPLDDIDMSLKYVTLCRRSGATLALERAHAYLVTLLGTHSIYRCYRRAIWSQASPYVLHVIAF